MNKIRIAVLGCGWIGLGAESDLLRDYPSTHASGILENDLFKLVGLQDISDESKRNAQRFSPDIPFYDSAEVLLKELKPDAVTIASPPETHCMLTELCINYGVRNILCEKPLSLNYLEAKNIVDKARKSKTNLVINHMRRFSPLVNKVRDYIQNNYIRDTLVGKIQTGIAFYDKGLFHCGTHIIDLLVYFFGSIRSVSAIHSSVFSDVDSDISPEVILEFEQCQLSLKPFNSREYAIADITLYGERGLIRLKDMWGRKVEFIGIRNHMDYSAYRELDEENKKVLMEDEQFMTSTYKYFSDIIRDKSKNKPSDNILHTMDVMDKISQSADLDGKRIRLDGSM